jgi:hypothetical protein
MNDQRQAPSPAKAGGPAEPEESGPPPRRPRRLRGYPARGEDISQINAPPLPAAPAGPSAAAAADPDPATAEDETS